MVTDSQQAIEFPADVRKRPGMWVGDVERGDGLHQLLWEVVANALDQHLAGHCSRITVRLREGSEVCIEDDGPGAPVEPRVGGRTPIEQALSQVHATGTFDGHRPHVHVGKAGAGLAVVNALSERLTIEIFREGRHYLQRYRQGRPDAPLAVVGRASRSGTRVTLVPDAGIFAERTFDNGLINSRLRELGELAPGLALQLIDRRRVIHCATTGLARRVERAVVGKPPLYPHGFGCDTLHNGIRIQVALRWVGEADPVRRARYHRLQEGRIDTFANLEPTPEGGTHLTGLCVGLCDAVAAQRIPIMGKLPLPVLQGESLRQGLFGAIQVLGAAVEFGGPTRGKVVNPEIGKAVRDVVGARLGEFLARHPELSRTLVLRVVTDAMDAARSDPRRISKRLGIRLTDYRKLLAEHAELARAHELWAERYAP